MSREVIYGVWVEKTEDKIIVSTVSESSNCFPKPRPDERGRLNASQWKVFSVDDEDGIREFVSRICSSYAGGSVTEAGGRLGADEYWNRWRSRFKRAGGPDIGKCQKRIECWYFSSELYSQYPKKVKFKSGTFITPEIAEVLIKHNKRAPIDALEKGEPWARGKSRRAAGSIGFVSCDELCYYSSSSRKRGCRFRFEYYDYYLRVAVSYQPKPNPSDKLKFDFTKFGMLDDDGYALVSTDYVVCGNRWGGDLDVIHKDRVFHNIANDQDYPIMNLERAQECVRIMQDNFQMGKWGFMKVKDLKMELAKKALLTA